jgi:ABC-type Fe3+ transport system permease subunit
MTALPKEASAKFTKTLYILGGTFLVILLTLVIVIIYKNKLSSGNDDLDDDKNKQKRQYLEKIIIFLYWCLFLLCLLIASVFVGKNTASKISSQVVQEKEWTQPLFNTLLKIVTTVIILISLKLATFIMKSYLKSKTDTELGKDGMYKQMILFFTLWMILIIVLFLIIFILYSIYLNRNGDLNWNMMKYFDHCYTTYMSFFAPNGVLLYIGFFTLLILNGLLITYYIETQKNDNIVTNSAINSKITGYDEEDDYEEDIDDTSGIGFINNLIDMIGKIDLVICFVLVWIIDWLR